MPFSQWIGNCLCMGFVNLCFIDYLPRVPYLFLVPLVDIIHCCVTLPTQVLDLGTYEARQRYYASRGQKHFYFMTLNGGEVCSIHLTLCFKFHQYPLFSMLQCLAMEYYILFLGCRHLFHYLDKNCA